MQLHPSKTIVAVERKMAAGGDGIGGQFCWRLLGPRGLTVGPYSFLSWNTSLALYCRSHQKWGSQDYKRRFERTFARQLRTPVILNGRFGGARIDAFEWLISDY
jgi:hypothetical protein